MLVGPAPAPGADPAEARPAGPVGVEARRRLEDVGLEEGRAPPPVTAPGRPASRVRSPMIRISTRAIAPSRIWIMVAAVAITSAEKRAGRL